MKARLRMPPEHLAAAKALSEKYEKLAVEDFINAKKALIGAFPSLYKEKPPSLSECLHYLTGFGSICTDIVCASTARCENCIFWRYPTSYAEWCIAPCRSHTTYKKLLSAKELPEMLSAVKARAKFLRTLFEAYDNKLKRVSLWHKIITRLFGRYQALYYIGAVTSFCATLFKKRSSKNQ